MTSRIPALFCAISILVAAVNSMPDAMLAPPGRPSEFRTPDQLRTYLKALNDYYAIVGRPRFGRSVNNKPDAFGQHSLTEE
ncbi:hypothetical protein DPMN_079822 [Dreissena polymorpha]|uniref:Neuropeptide F n=1 Tax=Dreissena polymorpha TaxID=45954 RepID=A0A9D4BR05_DREPO|nr:hypothetical protein DPMN_079399 [Dreissena polymorpha]KAH3704761.1 hypothetical protein DPMN_079822 [Dreissena polymorpha]